MVYMGSKNKFKKEIPPTINKYIKENNIENFYDCFCGGANLIDKIHCKNKIAIDLSPTLIALHKQAQENFNLIPEDGSREMWDIGKAQYNKIKKAISTNLEEDYQAICEIELYKIGAIEWYGSYSSGGFPRGYANNSSTRNYYKESRRNHMEQSKEEEYKKIKFTQGDYINIIDKNLSKNSLLYCDAPYQDTTPYGIAPKFNYSKYHKWLLEISKIVPVFVSEQRLPNDFDEFLIWKKEDVIRTTGVKNYKKASEKMWLIDRR